MAKAYDIIYRYIHEKKLNYFEITDNLDELFETRYKSETVRAESKELAKQDFLSTHPNIKDIVSVRELFATKNYDNGREL